MDEAPDASAHTGEIVFVLRLRLGVTGWWGQVQRLDPAGPTFRRLVGGTQELYDLFAQEVRAILAAQTARTPADRDYQIAKGDQIDGEDAI